MPSDASRLNAALARDRINLDLKTLRVGWDNQSCTYECPSPVNWEEPKRKSPN